MRVDKHILGAPTWVALVLVDALEARGLCHRGSRQRHRRRHDHAVGKPPLWALRPRKLSGRVLARYRFIQFCVDFLRKTAPKDV